MADDQNPWDLEPEEAADFEETAPPARRPRPAGDGQQRRPCPMCGEMIIADARKCRFCGERLVSGGQVGDFGDDVDVELLRRFRREIHGLSGAFIFFGVVAGGMGLVFLFADDAGLLQGMPPTAQLIMSVLMLGLGGIWLASGLAAAYKQLWGVYLGVALSYLNLFGSLINMRQRAVCAVIILIFIIVQGHRVIGFAKKLKRAGVPLDTKP